MRRGVVLSIFFFVLFSFFSPAAFGQVQTRLRIIRASNVGSNVDPTLSDVHKDLGSLFSFTSYRLLKDESFHLSPAEPSSISAWQGRITIQTTLIGLHKAVAELRIRVIREGKDILNTQVGLSRGRTVLIGGPRLRDGGVIIYALSANF